jgi:hypothetical protein
MTKPNPNARPYPKNRACRVDRSKMTLEEWTAHLAQKDREKSARWVLRNPGKTYAALRRRRAENPWYSSLRDACGRARKIGSVCDLSNEWAIRTYTGFCALTGLPFVVRSADERLGAKPGGGPYSPSIDRIDPLQGYIQENCRWVLHAINSFKQRMSDAEMLAIAQALVSHSATAERAKIRTLSAELRQHRG